MSEQEREIDRSASYETDPVVKIIEDFIGAQPAHRRLYPDLYSEELAEALRQVPAAGEAATEAETGTLRVEGHWLVREVDHHTCGTSPDGYYGAHEPGCGLVPEVDLSALPGWRSEADIKAEALREAADAMRLAKEPGHWNLRDPLYADITLSPDEWMERRAFRLAFTTDAEGSK